MVCSPTRKVIGVSRALIRIDVVRSSYLWCRYWWRLGVKSTWNKRGGLKIWCLKFWMVVWSVKSFPGCIFELAFALTYSRFCCVLWKVLLILNWGVEYDLRSFNIQFNNLALELYRPRTCGVVLDFIIHMMRRGLKLLHIYNKIYYPWAKSFVIIIFYV